MTAENGRTCTVVLTVTDAVGVGHSIRALIRAAKLPPGTRAIYERVAGQMLAAAKVEILAP